MNALEELCGVLETHKGRDKILRAICYGSRLLSLMTTKYSISEKFATIGSSMAGTRATLRLLDDIPMLKYNIVYGLGRSEQDRFSAVLQVVTNIIDQIYYIPEKMMWLGERKIINCNVQEWDTYSNICWGITSYLTLIKTLWHFSILQKHKMEASKDTERKATVAEITAVQNSEAITCFKLIIDVIQAVQAFPAGFLWASKLQSWHITIIGLISSCIGIYQVFAKRRM